MKTLPITILTGVILLLSTGFCVIEAKAQGCGQISIDEGNVSCCDGTEEQPDLSCGGNTGDPSDYCSEGYGECCGVAHGTTSITYDPIDCGQCQPSGSPPYNPPCGDYWDYNTCS